MREQSGGEKKRNNMKKKERREARRNKHLKNVGVFFLPRLLASSFFNFSRSDVCFGCSLSRLFTRRHPVCTDSVSVESDATNARLSN